MELYRNASLRGEVEATFSLVRKLLVYHLFFVFCSVDHQLHFFASRFIQGTIYERDSVTAGLGGNYTGQEHFLKLALDSYHSCEPSTFICSVGAYKLRLVRLLPFPLGFCLHSALITAEDAVARFLSSFV